jgi:hypothetical protein
MAQREWHSLVVQLPARPNPTISIIIIMADNLMQWERECPCPHHHLKFLVNNFADVIAWKWGREYCESIGIGIDCKLIG